MKFAEPKYYFVSIPIKIDKLNFKLKTTERVSGLLFKLP